MKKLFIATCTLFFTITVNAQTTDSIYDKICRLNFHSFVDKPVGQFIDSLPSGYNASFVGDVVGNKVRALILTYPGGSKITINVIRYHFMDPEDVNRIWNLSLFKKENLAYASLNHYDYDGRDSNP